MQFRRFANFSCPVRIHHASFVLNDLECAQLHRITPFAESCAPVCTKKIFPNALYEGVLPMTVPCRTVGTAYSRTRLPRRQGANGKSLNLVVHVVSFFSRADTCAQFDDREVVYSENGAFATTSAKLGDVYPSTYRTPKSRTMLSKVLAGFRRTMFAKAIFESVF